MDIHGDLPAFLAELDAQRIACGLSYQAVADACGVSKATIQRTLTGVTEPTVHLVQSIAAAVQYKPPTDILAPADATQDAYITYLTDSMRRQQEDNDRRVRQLQAHYNMLHRQDRRTIMILGAILGVLVLFICCLFLYDFAHLDRGWVQAQISRFDGGLSSAVQRLAATPTP